MPIHSFTTFSKTNRRQIYLLVSAHLLWCAVIFVLWSLGRLVDTAPHWSALFVIFQLYAAAQLLLPALLLQPEERKRGFYIFWGAFLLSSIWLLNQLPGSDWRPLLEVFKSGLLLLVATLIGAALARYVRHLWEVIPVCIAMTLADFASWSYGPTAVFSEQIREYYLAPQGQPPLIDMLLVKLALPGSAGLAPVFGISDWIMVVFFALVAQRHAINDNLLGPVGETLARRWRIGVYLPISVAALLLAIVLAHATGRFIPALPVVALVMSLWYAVRYLKTGRQN